MLYKPVSVSEPFIAYKNFLVRFPDLIFNNNIVHIVSAHAAGAPPFPSGKRRQKLTQGLMPPLCTPQVSDYISDNRRGVTAMETTISHSPPRFSLIYSSPRIPASTRDMWKYFILLFSTYVLLSLISSAHFIVGKAFPPRFSLPYSSPRIPASTRTMWNNFT